MNTKSITFGNWAFFRTALLMAALTAGLALPPAARAVAESEPNDTLGQATAVGLNDSVTAAIGFTGDQDWYRVTVNAPGRLQLSLLSPPAGMRAQMEIYSRNADWMGIYVTAINDGDNVYLAYDVTDPGTYFVRITDAASGFSLSGYTLQTRFTPVADAYEPNNRIGQARLLAASPISAFAFDRSDRDWYKIYAPSNNTLTFTIQPPAAMRPQIELYDPDSAWMGVYSVAANPGDSAILNHRVQRSGLYYASVFDAAGGSHTNAYFLAVSGGTLGYIPPETPVTTETEPNDRLGDAQLFNLGAAVSGQIGAANDVDWYRFVPNQAGQLVVSCTRSPAALTMRIRLYDDAGNYLMEARAGGLGRLFSLTYDIKTPNPLLVVIDSPTGLFSSDTYEFHTQLTPVSDPYEPNDNYGDAKLITQLNRVEGFVYPTGDRDWFKINVDGPTNLTITMSQVPANIAPRIQVYDSSKRSLAYGSGLAGMDYELTYPVLAAGSYLIEVGDAGDNDETVAPYTLTIFGASFAAYAPVARIDTIVPGAIVQGDTIQFRGSGFDVDGAVAGYAWRSSIDGVLSAQAEFSTTALSIGTHTIYFKVRDNSGLWSTETTALVYVGSSISTEQEPNDTLSRANEIALNRPARGKINTVGDRDAFKVYIDQPGHLTFRLSNVPTNLVLQAACYNHTWDWLGLYQTAPLEGDSVAVSMDITQKGFAYVLIEDVHGQANTNLTYTLTATNALALDAYEENDSMLHAARLTNETVNALFFPAGNADWYSVWVEPGVGVTVTVVPPATARPQVEFYDANRAWIGLYATAPNDGDTVTISNRFAKPGFIFIRVIDTLNRANWAQSYRLTVSGAQPGFVPPDLPVTTEREPNNEISDANRVTLSVPVSGTVNTNWDGDWYSAVMPTPGVLRAVMEVPDTLRGRIRVFRADAAQINSRTGTNPGDDVTLDTRITEPGAYYFLVDSTDLQPISRPYQFTVSAVPVVDGFEDNNRMQNAARLSQQNRIQAYIFDTGDVDWYQVSADAGTTVRASVADVPASIRPWVGIYDRHGTLLAAKQASNDGQEVSVEQSVAETADYFILVQDAGSDNFSVDPYTLVVTGAKFTSYVPLAFIDSVTPNPAITNQPVTLTGHGTDQDGTIIGYEWRSSLDGVFSQSAVVDGKRDFSIGRHIITLKVKDNDQNWSPETATILYVGSTVPQEIEPNDAAGAGTRIEFDLLYTGAINPSGDQDWYRVYVPQAGRITFDVINPSATNNQMRTQIDFYGRDVQWLGLYVTAANPLDPVRLTVDITDPGEYYLRVFDVTGKANGRYTLQARLGPVQDPFEPNDTGRDAARLAPTSRTEAFLFPAGDSDWYKVTVDHPGELRLALTNMPADLRGQIDVYDRDLSYIGVYRTAINAGEAVNLVYDIPAPGTYFIRVIDADNHANATQPYTLILNFTPVVDVFEPNGDFISATPLAGSPVEAYLFPGGEIDYYKVYAMAGATLSATVDQVPPNIRPQISLYNANCSYLTYVNAAGNGQSATLNWPNANGYYYVRVQDVNNDRSPSGTYRLTISNANFNYVLPATPVTTETEPNNDFGSANLVAIGTAVAGRCAGNYDEDWFRFTVDRPGLLTIALNAPSGLLAQVRLYNANVSRLGERAAENRGDAVLFNAPLATAGMYYLDIFDQTGAASSNYQFTLTFDPTQDNNEPNDRFTQTTPLEFGQPVQGAIFPNGDADWYLLRIEESGLVRFEVRNVPEALQMGLQVYDGNKNLVFSHERLNSGDPLDVTWMAATPGWYHVQLYDRGGDGYATAPYTLQASFTPARDAAEPNNHFGEAASLTGTNQVTALIYPVRDYDWFRFTVGHAGRLRIQVSQAEGIQPVIQLFNNSNGRLTYVTAQNDGDTIELQYDVTAPGMYYVVVSDRDDNETSRTPYILTILGGEFDVSYPIAVIDAMTPNPALLGQTVTLTGSGVDQDGTVLSYEWWSDLDGALGSGATRTTSLLSEGVHRIGLRVQDNSGNWSARAYRDLVVARTLQTEDEPNNDVAHAFPLPLDTWITGRISAAGDLDYYRIYVGATGFLLMQLNAVPRTMRPLVELLGPNGEWLGLSLSANNDGDYLRYGVLVRSGWYVVRIADNNGRAQSTTYALRCGLTPGADVAEPNDTPAQASPVMVNTTVTNSFISPPGDVDWYRLNLTQPGRLSLLATNVPSNLRLQLDVYDVNLAFIGVYRYALNGGEPVNLLFDVERLGTYFVRVIDADTHGSVQPFELRFGFTPVVDPYENNDDMGHATLLTNATMRAYSFPAGDIDFYKVYCNTGAVLRLWITNLPASSVYSLQIYSPNQDWLGVYQQANNAGDDVYLEYAVPGAGLYFLRVRDESNLSQLTPYELRIAGGQLGFVPPFNPVATESEDNGTLSRANDVALATWVTGTIQPIGDYDWFRFYVNAPGFVRITHTDVRAPLLSELWVYNASAGQIGYRRTTNPGETNVLDLTVNNGGYCYVRLHDYGDDHATNTPYRLKIEHTPVVDPLEPNNDFASATRLGQATVNAYLFDGSDEDWYRVYMRGPGTLALSLDAVPPELRPHLWIYDANYSQLGSWVNTNPGVGGTNVLSVTVAGERFYYIRVRDETGGVSSNQYTLRITGADFSLAPQLEAIGDRTLTETLSYSIVLHASDPDNSPALTYSAANLPPGAIFDASTHTFRWTPARGLAGTYPGVHFQVSNGTQSDSEDITLTVLPFNHQPVLAWTGEPGYTANGVSPDSGAPADTFIYRVTYSDADGDLPPADWPKVHILSNGVSLAGSPFAMTVASSMPVNMGQIFSLSMRLVAGTNYSYRFQAFDARGLAAVGATNTMPGPGVFEDTDGDGLPDWWEKLYFGSPTAADPAADPDNDRFPNLSEYRAGTNPTNSQSFLGMRAITVTPTGTMVSWSSEPGKFYQLERATNLGQGFDQVVQGNIAATPPTNSNTDTNAVGQGPFFYRVRLIE